jgi:hypothetical protein
MTSIYAEVIGVYAGHMPNEDPDTRVVIQARVKRASADRIAAIAAQHLDWTVSDALRHLLALGVAAHDAGATAPGEVTRRPAQPPPDENFTARHARLNQHRTRGTS